MEKSYFELVTTARGMKGMCRFCEKSLRMRDSSTISGTSKNHVVMNTAKILLHKTGRVVGLDRRYSLCSRDPYIRSGDSYIRGSRNINIYYFPSMSSTK